MEYVDQSVIYLREGFANINNPRRQRTALLGLVQRRLSVFARLAKVDVNGVNIVSLFLQPNQNYRRIQSA